MKKALTVGINQYPSAPLQGCVNDMEDVFRLLTQKGGYTPENVRAVADERATTQGIWERMEWLRVGVKAGDEVLFHYSGHGSQILDRGAKDEVLDSKDEILCPVDLDWSQKMIVDDDIGEWLKKFPPGVRIIIIFDCCHSGSGTRDLMPPPGDPGIHLKSGVMHLPKTAQDLAPRDRYLPPPPDIFLRGEDRDLPLRRIGRVSPPVLIPVAPKPVVRLPIRGQRGVIVAPVIPIAPTASNLGHILISGCRSDQTSADAYIKGRYNGALTRFLIEEVLLNPKRPLKDLHGAMRKKILDSGYTQDSQLEGNAALLAAPIFS